MRRGDFDKPENRPEQGHELLKKMEELIEEQPETEQEVPPQEEPARPVLSERRKRALILYMACLLLAAFLLVTASLILEIRSSRDTNSELSQGKNNAIAKAEQLQDENRTLSNANAVLQDNLNDALNKYDALMEDYGRLAERVESLESQASRAAKTRQAYELLLTAQNALDREDMETFLTAVRTLKRMTDYLDQEGLTLLEALEKAGPQENQPTQP